MSIYKKRAKADELNVEGGYQNNFWFAPKADFLVVAAPGAYAALGDAVEITADHTFGVADGFLNWRAKKHGVTHTSETTGDAGSRSFVHKFTVDVLGDDSKTLEQMQEMLNDDIIVLLKDQDCNNADEYVQFGDACLTADFNITFNGNRTSEGLKIYTIEGTVKGKKFFYSGAVTEKPVV
jgi:hypothetical protein